MHRSISTNWVELAADAVAIKKTPAHFCGIRVGWVGGWGWSGVGWEGVGGGVEWGGGRVVGVGLGGEGRGTLSVAKKKEKALTWVSTTADIIPKSTMEAKHLNGVNSMIADRTSKLFAATNGGRRQPSNKRG